MSIHLKSTNISVQERDRLQQILHELVQNITDPALMFVPNDFGPAPAAVLCVDAPGFHFQEAIGVTDIETKMPVQTDDRFEIGSNTKMFTAILLLQLEEEGILSLDDPLSRWLPDWAQKIPYGEEITLRQMANHTAGLWDYADDIIGGGLEDPDILRRAYTPEELVAYALEHGEQEFTPGEEDKWKYSNTGYILLGMVLEAASGQPYADLLRERIFEPLELHETSFPNTIPAPDAIIQGYSWWPDGVNTTEWNLSQGWAAGGIISTAADMTTFLQALSRGQVFKNPQTLARMAEFVRNEGLRQVKGDSGYGIGLIGFAGHTWGHGGQTLGFESAMMFVPDHDVTLVALTNAAFGPTPLINQFAPVLEELAGLGEAPGYDEMASPLFETLKAMKAQMAEAEAPKTSLPLSS